MLFVAKKYFMIICFTFCIFSNAYPQNFKVLNYLKSITGTKTVAGQHNREPNSQPEMWTDSIYTATGKYPGFWSGDFLFESESIANRWTVIHEAKKQWDNGAIVQLMFHCCPPTQAEPCGWSSGVQSHLTDSQWKELITDGTQLNKNWKARLDKIVPYFQYLKENGVEVLFRPLHEMNQGHFWWGGRPGPNGTARLYQITHDYMESKGLTNIIWVWDLQDFSTLSSDINTYDPGSKYWDILALDVYWSDGLGYTSSKYNIIKSKAGDKPIAIGECQTLPSASILSAQPRWSFFMGWAELVLKHNTITKLKNLYNASNVVTLDRMPNWKTFNAYSGTPYSIPGKIESENFDNGGEGVSYHDSDTVNTGGKYRLDVGVDIDTSSEGGYAVTDIRKGEWLNYVVKVDTSGIYTLKIRTSSKQKEGSFRVYLDSTDISGLISVPNTGGNQKWISLSATTPWLMPGIKIMRVVMESDSFNLDYLKFTLSNRAPQVAITSPPNRARYSAPSNVTIRVAATDDGGINKVEYYANKKKLGESTTSPYSYVWTDVSIGNYVLSAKAIDNTGLTAISDTVNINLHEPETPYDTIAYPVPGRIEAENYDNGGEGISYHDLTAGNMFNVYRHDDVDIGICTDTTGGYAVGYFQSGEWLQYTINVTKTQDYDIEIRVAAQSPPAATISIDLDGKDLTGQLNVNTGGAQTWESIVKTNVPLTAGQKKLRINSLSSYPNINFINIKPSSVEDVKKNLSEAPKKYYLYQNYPNPFNPTTIIKYETPKSSYVTLRIYDSIGREVKTLVNAEQRSGYYSVKFDGRGLSSGVYFYKLRAGNYYQAKQMILIK